MQLSEDQKQRILDEESQLLAEEQYRAKVRLDLRNRAETNSTPMAAPPQAAPKPIKGAKNRKGFLLLLIIPAVVAALWIVRSSASNEPYAPSVFATKHAEKIVSGQVSVGAGKMVFYKISIQDMHDARVTGHFVAYGGLGNDIDVFIAEEKEFGKWLDGQPSKVRYQSGKVTTGDIDVKLPLLNAAYYLCFNNKFSAFSAKTIDADVTLSYSTIVLK
jgi:hypothetical protein